MATTGLPIVQSHRDRSGADEQFMSLQKELDPHGIPGQRLDRRDHLARSAGAGTGRRRPSDTIYYYNMLTNV